ncbi:TPA: hypothetical protein ACH3X1_004044 [Trebouxia sp. C0004]
MSHLDAGLVPWHMTSTSPRDNRSIGTEAAGLLLMCEQALLIQKNASQVGGTKMANCSAENEQFWLLMLAAAGHCMQEATVHLLRHVAACK